MVREFTARLPVAAPQTRRLTDHVVAQAAESPARVLFSRRVRDHWYDVTATQFKHQVEQAAKGLLASGLQAGDRVALICSTRYEWTLLDYALWWVGAVTVPLYQTSPVEHIGWVLADSGATACIVETPEHAARVEQASAKHPGLRVWVIDDGAVAELTSAGAGVAADALEARRTAVAPGDLATVIYTSGTTGQPRGCMLTQANLVSELRVALDELGELFNPEGSTLLFLPLAHVFARVVQLGCVAAGVRLGHTADVRRLGEDLADFQPTFVLGVPRIFEKLFTAVSQQAHGEGRGRVFDAAVDAAIEYSRALDRGRVSPLRRLRRAGFDRLVYARLRAALGGRATYAISGGAPLGERLAHFFRGSGVTILEGYGLTETTAALTVNLPSAVRIGTVGRPLAGTSVRVAEDGELLVKGDQVFQGYWRNESATRAALTDDGWFRTGDVGDIDAEGYVWVHGRKTEILVTAGGKRVVPAGLEDVVRGHPLVGQCLVVGEARPYVAALVTLDPATFAAWRDRQGKTGDVRSLTADPDLVAEIQRAVDAANGTVSPAEAIRRFAILPVDWTEDSGHLTPTLKVRRRAVLRDFARAVEDLYR